MMGITSLPGAQQNPGQAAPASAPPAPQPKTPQAMTGQLQSLPPQQLMAMFANPADRTPKWAVVTAYAKAIEQQRLMQAAAGQAAMQQGQMQAGQPPVAMQVMMRPQMARHGGVMQGYSGGGAVAFAGGTGPQGLDSRQPYGSFEPTSSEEAFAMDALRVEEAQRKKRIKELEEKVGFLQGAGAPQAVAVAQELARLKGSGAPLVTTKPLPPTAPAGVASLPGAELNTPQARAASAGAEDVMGEFARLASLVERAESGSLGQSAVSPKGAIGVMQVMPGTAPEAAKLAGVPFDEKLYRTDPEYNRRIGQAYLMKQLEDFGGDTAKALAAYNAGPGRVKKAIETAMRSRGDANWLDFVPDETKNYVQKIMTSYSGGVPGEFARKDMPPSAPRPAGGPGIAALPAAAAAAPVAGQGISPTLNPELEAAIKARATQLEASKNLPPEVLEARKGLAALEAANIEAQRAATGAFGKESAETLEAARRARSASRLDDIQYIGQMLEGMRGAKRLGEGLAGAAAGAGRAEAGRAAALKEAEKLRREDQRLIRAEEAAGRQLQILAQQRVVAERQGEVDRVAKIDAEIAQVKLGLAQAKQAQAEKAAEFGLKERKTAAEETQSRAAGQRQATPFEQFMANPQQYARFIELTKGSPMAASLARVQQAIAAEPRLKELAKMASLAPNSPQAAEYRKAVEEITLRVAPEMLLTGTSMPSIAAAQSAADNIIGRQ